MAYPQPDTLNQPDTALLRMVDGIFILGEKYILVPEANGWDVRTVDGELLDSGLEYVAEVLVTVFDHERGAGSSRETIRAVAKVVGR